MTRYWKKGQSANRRIGKEPRLFQCCPLDECKYPIAPFPNGEIGHFFFVYRPVKMRIEHVFTDCRQLKDRRIK